MQNHKKNIDKIIKECIKIKIDTVEKDFKENDLRSIFKFWTYHWSRNRKKIFI